MHEKFMRIALKEAHKAREIGEIPVGAVLVREGKIYARGHNRNIIQNDPSAHAEVVALRRGGKKSFNHRLTGSILYSTIEPCSMCVGALILARVKEIVFGAKDPKTGACGSVFNIARNKKLNHRINITSGILEDECSAVLKRFFKKKRKKHKKQQQRVRSKE